ncbi:MAG: hypothetical protein ACOC1O_05785 [bacterium]
MKNKLDGFEQREQVSDFGYWDDPRWKEVRKLRKNGNTANGLVMKIRSDWGVD